MSLSKLDYCRYLLSSPVNYTSTNMADPVEELSHDRINRYLRGEKLTPRLLWESVREVYTPSKRGTLVFDDTVLDKGFGPAIEMTRRQWSGNAHGIIRGIGLVSCLYVNPELEQFWVIDYRIFDPEGDGKTKIDHVEEMLHSVKTREIAFQTVLMDSWYATKRLMLLIDNRHKDKAKDKTSADKKLFYCPLKSNRRVDDSGGSAPYRAVSELEWNEDESETGKTIKIYGFPKDSKVQLFRVSVSFHRTDYVVTNDASQSSTQDTRQVCAVRRRLSSITARSNNALASNRASAAKLVSSAIMSTVRCWRGRDSKTSLTKTPQNSTNSNTDCSEITSFNNSKDFRLACSLRKSYGRLIGVTPTRGATCLRVNPGSLAASLRRTDRSIFL